MKKLLFLFCFVSSFGPLWGQGLTLSIRDEGGALPYANIFLNDRFYAAADSLGFAFIPQNQLTDGIVISSSWIGTEPCVVVYNSTMADTCVLTHHQTAAYDIDAVTITASDQPYQWRQFRKLVNPRTTTTHNCLVRGAFRCSFSGENETPRIVEGTFVLENRIPRGIPPEDFLNYYFKGTPSVQTVSDTVGLSRKLNNYIPHEIDVACQSIGRLWSEYHSNGAWGSYLRYRGEADGTHHFRLAYSQSDMELISNTQILFEADRSSREIVRIIFKNMLTSRDLTGSGERSFSLQKFRGVHVPASISTVRRLSDGILPIIEIELTDLIFEPLR